MTAYIDLHNHILHAIDDGPGTLKESVLLARAMVEAGYSTVVTTPHVVEGRPAPELIKDRINELQTELNRQQIPLSLLPGAEHHIDPQILERLQDGTALTLNNSRYLLLELPFFQPLPPYTEQLIFNLKTHGYCPIIPHPERAVALQKDYDLIHRLHQAGALYQVTWGAITGRLGPLPEKVAHHIVKVKLTHLFATDAHNFAGRLMDLQNATATLEYLLGPGTAEPYLTDLPRAVINNEEFKFPPAAEYGAPTDKTPSESPFKRLFTRKRS